MPKGLQQKGIVRRNKMIREGIRLFLENGYTNTSTASIATAAGMSASSFFAAFESKESLLLALVGIMFDKQFSMAENMFPENAEPVLLYCIETALQMYITELSEPLQELYVTAYSLPSTSEFIYRKTSTRLAKIFAKELPDAQPKDFYEMEIASSGVMRAFMAKRCDLYFDMESKLRRFLQSNLTLYHVSEARQSELIEHVLQMDLKPVAEKIISTMEEKAKNEIDLLFDD